MFASRALASQAAVLAVFVTLHGSLDDSVIVEKNVEASLRDKLAGSTGLVQSRLG